MTFQEILDEIVKHRATRLHPDGWLDLARKIDEIEWALQALAERLRDITSPVQREQP